MSSLSYPYLCMDLMTSVGPQESCHHGYSSSVLSGCATTDGLHILGTTCADHSSWLLCFSVHFHCSGDQFGGFRFTGIIIGLQIHNRISIPLKGFWHAHVGWLFLE